MWNAGLDEAQAGIKIARRNINNLRYADDTTLMAKNKEELKSLLMKVKEESEKAGLKLSIQKTKIMASGPITSWQIDRATMVTVRDLIFLGSKITLDGDCSHEIKRHLFLGRKAMTNLDSIIKSRDITLLTKVHVVKAVFSSSHVEMWESDHKGRRRRGRQRWDGWMASLTQWTWVWVNSGSWWWTGKPGVLQSMESQRVRHDWVTELNWIKILTLYGCRPTRKIT